MSKIYPIVLSLVSASFCCFSQTEIPTGTWRTHFNYTSAEKVEFVGSKVYCSSKNGLFYFETDDNSLQKLSKLDGLSDAGVSAMKYVQNEKIFVLGYINGNVDFITESGVKNLDVIKKSSINESEKQIFNIIENNDLLFLSTGLGVIVIDLNSLRVKETYKAIGPEAQEIEAYQTAFFNDSLFVASDLGVLTASFDPAVNLVDFNSWALHDETYNLPSGAMRGIVAFNDFLIAHNGAEIYRYDGTWSLFDYQPEVNIRSVTVSGDKLIVSLENSVVEIDSDGVQSYSTGIVAPVYSLSKNDDLWIADKQQGLIHYKSGTSEKLVPNGPFSPDAFNLAGKAGGMIVVGGGFDQNLEPENLQNGFYLFEHGKWNNYNVAADDAHQVPDMQDLVNADYDAASGNTYFGSFGDGILAWNKEGIFQVVDDNVVGSTLRRNSDGELLITDIKAEGSGIWILNYGVSESLHRWDGADIWEGYNIGTSYPYILLNSEFGEKWMAIDPNHGGGISVFDPGEKLYRRLTTSKGNGGLPSNNITAIAEDLEGEMWVGTVSGIVYYSQPYLALENEDGVFFTFDAVYPIIENDIFLRDQYINDILVDPGNRKWISTNEGVWVVDRNGGEVIYHFNEENSPLPSDRILKMDIVKETGEVFFIADKGMVSFRADASQPKANYSAVKIFPNPVYPDKTGVVTISGLIDQSIVKITDTSGKLIWETRSSGGTATWNTVASSVETGIYLIFTTDEEANEKFVGKVAVVR